MSPRAARSRAAAAQRRARRRTFLAVIAVIVGVLAAAAAVLILLGGKRGVDTGAAAVQGYPYSSLQMFPPDPGGPTTATRPPPARIPAGPPNPASTMSPSPNKWQCIIWSTDKSWSGITAMRLSL